MPTQMKAPAVGTIQSREQMLARRLRDDHWPSSSLPYARTDTMVKAAAVVRARTSSRGVGSHVNLRTRREDRARARTEKCRLRYVPIVAP